MKIYCDGSGWNGKRSRFAIACEDGRSKIVELKECHTNNEMEYAAVIQALMGYANPGDEILTDSQLVVNQANGFWKVKEQRLFEFCQRAKELLIEKNCTLNWIPREESRAGHLLEK